MRNGAHAEHLFSEQEIRQGLLMQRIDLHQDHVLRIVPAQNSPPQQLAVAFRIESTEQVPQIAIQAIGVGIHAGKGWLIGVQGRKRLDLHEPGFYLAERPEDQPEIHLEEERMVGFAGHIEFGGHGLSGNRPVLRCVQLADQIAAVAGHAIHQRGGKEAGRFAIPEGYGHAAGGLQAGEEAAILLRREAGVEALSELGDHAFSTNSPPRMMMRSSAQISNLRPTTSM